MHTAKLTVIVCSYHNYGIVQQSSELNFSASRMPQMQPVHYILCVLAAVIVVCYKALPLCAQDAKFSIAIAVDTAYYLCVLHRVNILSWKTFLYS